VVADTGAYPRAVIEEFKRLAEECSICYQCGTCTSSCPSGRELYRGPRRIVRLILAGAMVTNVDSEKDLATDSARRVVGRVRKTALPSKW